MTGNGWVLHSAILVETREGVSLSQAAAPIPTYEISFESNIAFAAAFLFNTANIPSAPPGNFDALSGMGINLDPVQWQGYLEVNDSSNPGVTQRINPGEKFYVRVQNSSGWTMSQVYTFTLQNSDQVCTLG